MNDLIADFRFELVADHHSPGSGRYGLKIVLSQDISCAFPYLNRVLEDSVYDHENRVLIGNANQVRYAFRPHEIRVALIPDPSKSAEVAREVVDLVNAVWRERGDIEPDLRRNKLPGVYDIFRLLPRTNCKRCSCPSCLAFASKLRGDPGLLEQCEALLEEEWSVNRGRIEELFSPK